MTNENTKNHESSFNLNKNQAEKISSCILSISDKFIFLKTITHNLSTNKNSSAKNSDIYNLIELLDNEFTILNKTLCNASNYSNAKTRLKNHVSDTIKTLRLKVDELESDKIKSLKYSDSSLNMKNFNNLIYKWWHGLGFSFINDMVFSRYSDSISMNFNFALKTAVDTLFEENIDTEKQNISKRIEDLKKSGLLIVEDGGPRDLKIIFNNNCESYLNSTFKKYFPNCRICTIRSYWNDRLCSSSLDSLDLIIPYKDMDHFAEILNKENNTI